MGALVKQTITEITFMDSLSTEDDMRYLKLRLDSEGSGRSLILSSESKDSEIYFYSPDDLKALYEAAVKLWEQGDIYFEGDASARC